MLGVGLVIVEGSRKAQVAEPSLPPPPPHILKAPPEAPLTPNALRAAAGVSGLEVL